jgi:hypothetical protein
MAHPKLIQKFGAKDALAKIAPLRTGLPDTAGKMIKKTQKKNALLPHWLPPDAAGNELICVSLLIFKSPLILTSRSRALNSEKPAI